MSTILIKLSRVRASITKAATKVVITALPYLLGTAGIVALFFIVAALIALPVMWTWDYTMPDVFGLPELTFWQALWGTVMCRFLFTDVGIKLKSK